MSDWRNHKSYFFLGGLILIYLMFLPVLSLLSAEPYVGGDIREHYTSLERSSPGAFYGEYIPQKIGGEYLFLDQPPLFFFLLKLASYIFPLGFLFRLSIFSLIIATPLLAYWMFRKLQFQKKHATIGALSIALLATHTYFPKSGGTILSLILGEITYYASYLGILIFIGFLKSNNRFLLPFFVGMIFLTNPIIGICVIVAHFITKFIVLKENFLKTSLQLFYDALIILSMTLWWIIGFLISGSSSSPKTDFLIATTQFILSKPVPITLTLIIGICGLIYIRRAYSKITFKRFTSEVVFILTLLGISSFFYFSEFIGWSIRFIPIMLLSSSILLCYIILKHIKKITSQEYVIICAGILLITALILFTHAPSHTMSQTLNHHFENQKNQSELSQLQKLYDSIPTNQINLIFIDSHENIHVQKNENKTILNIIGQKNVLGVYMHYITYGIGANKPSDVAFDHYAEYFGIDFIIIDKRDIDYFRYSQTSILNQTEDFILLKTNQSGKLIYVLSKNGVRNIFSISQAVSQRVNEISQTQDADCEVNSAYQSYGTYNINTSCPNQSHIIKISYNPFWKYFDYENNKVEIKHYNPGYLILTPKSTQFTLTYKLPLAIKLLIVLCFISISASILAITYSWRKKESKRKQKT